MGCCGSDKQVNPGVTNGGTGAEGVRDRVREGYARIAEAGALAAGTGGGCCGDGGWSAEQLAERVGYSAEEVTTLPEGANMGLSCGNPTAIAQLEPGQVVLDLGSGGGFDWPAPQELIHLV